VTLPVFLCLVLGQGPLPPGHPDITAEDQAGQDAGAVSAQELLRRLDQMKSELKERPKTAEIEFALGNLYYDNARWPDAIDAYRQLLERAVDPIQRFLALRGRARRKPSPQMRCGESGTPAFAVLIAAAETSEARGDVEAALACYRQALLPLAVALTRQANAWYLIGNDDLAVAVHRRALELVPDNPDSLFFLGAIFFESGEGNLERLGQAKAVWTRFLAVVDAKTDPERYKIVTRDLVRVQLALDSHGHVAQEPAPEMQAMAVGPIAAPPPAPVLNGQQRRSLEQAVAEGEAALSRKRWEAARDAFARARRLDPGDLAAARGEGTALLNQGKLLEAEAALRDGLGREPTDALSLYELGEVYSRSEHYAGAAKFWLQVVEEDPKLAAKLELPAKIRRAEQLQ